MIDTFVLFALIFSNARIATRKGRNGFGWGFLTMVSYMLVAGMLGAVYVLITYKGPLTPLALQDYMARLQHDTMKSLTITLFGVGGGLGIRFLLEQLPAKNANNTTI